MGTDIQMGPTGGSLPVVPPRERPLLPMLPG